MYRYILIPILYLMVLSPLISCSVEESDDDFKPTTTETTQQKQKLYNTQLQTLEKAKQVNQQLNKAAEERKTHTNQ